MNYLAKYGFILVLITLLSGWAGHWLKPELIIKGTDAVGLEAFWNRFLMLSIVAALIERSVETYLNVTRQNGQVVYDQSTDTYVKTSDASKEAMTAALVLSLLVAICGVRIIESLVTIKGNAHPFMRVVWNGVDVVVSAGLMAGGSDLFHKLAAVITTGLGRVRDSVGSSESRDVRSRAARPLAGAPRSVALVNEVELTEPLRSYSLTIERPRDPHAEQGKLVFSDGGLKINAACWWDKGNRIDAGTYTRCSKTHMAEYGFEAIYLPDAVSKTSGQKTIFIHHGSSPSNSLGCFAVTTSDFKALWGHIRPQNVQNITVVVSDV